jgi:diguanylate cyclase
MGFATWMVTRTNGDDWIVLAAQDQVYGIEPGQVFRWSDSFCYRMVRGAPRIAPDANDVPAYATAPIGDALPIAAYVGIPLMRLDGSLFGTLCAIDPSRQDDSITENMAVMETMARILCTMLEADLTIQHRDRELESSRMAADIDELTGVLNRKGWSAAVRAEELRSRRYGHSAALAVLDLDELKRVNDTSGHAAGDALLRRAAETLRGTVRNVDVVARIGGDEFAILFPETSAPELLLLEKRLESAFRKEGIAISAGFAEWDRRMALTETLSLADRAMYRQKASRKSSSPYASPSAASDRARP